MSLPDATASAQLASGSVFPAFVGWLDIDTDPVRVTTSGVDITFSGTGDDDLDGFTYSAVDPSVVGVSAILNKEDGAETVTLSLSGIVGPDTDLLNLIGDKSKWQGRTVRLWGIIRNAAGTQQGAVWPFFTGRMSAVRINGEPTQQTIEMDVETYLASLTSASGRTYLDQSLFDPADETAELKIGAANGATKGVASVNKPLTNYPSYLNIRI